MKKKFSNFLKRLSEYTKTDTNYVVKGSFWWIFGRIFAFLSSFFVLMAFAKFASKEVYGSYQYVISLTAILGIFCLPGIDTALISSIARQKEKTFFLAEQEKLKFGVIASIILFLISFWYLLKRNFELGISFFISAIFLPFLAIFQLYLTIWHGRKKFDIQNRYFVIHNFLAALFLILIIILKPKLAWVVFAYYFGFSLTTFLFWIKTRKKIQKSTEEEKETISFGKHLTLMNVPYLVAGQIDNVLLWHITGPNLVAIYSYALRFIERVFELIPFSALALPKMANVDIQRKEVKREIFNKFLKLFWISGFFTFLYILICPLFFKIFFPPYKESIIYSQVLAIILLLSPFSFLSTIFLAQMKKNELYVLNFFPNLIKILLFFIFIPILKIWGGVLAILISQISYAILTVYFFKKI